MWNERLALHKLIGRGFHKTTSQQQWGLAYEIRHKPGHGVTRELFLDTLQSLGFAVALYPHNHELGAEALRGETGRAKTKYRLGNLVSGRRLGVNAF